MRINIRSMQWRVALVLTILFCVSITTTVQSQTADGTHLQYVASPGEPNIEGALTLVERNRVRRAVRKSGILVKEKVPGRDVPAFVDGEVVVGRPLPATLPVRPVPNSLLTTFPPRPGHEYWIFADNLVLIDRNTRNVVDIVRDIY